jgi:hypothetical protein
MLSKSIFLLATFLGFQSLHAGVFPQDQKEILFYVSDTIVPSKAKIKEEVKAVVSGLFPNSCYRYSRSKVERDEENNVVSISTYAIVSPGMCLTVIVPFTKEVKMGFFEPGEYKVKFLGPDDTFTEKRMIIE